MNILSLISTLLRSPERLADLSDEQLSSTIPELLGLLAVSSLIFGAVVGSYRGGVQLAYAAVKMPALMLLPAMLVVPAVPALWRAFGSDISHRRAGVLALLATTRTSMIAAAAAPVVWLMYSSLLDYHMAILALAGTLLASGLVGVGGVFPALPSRSPMAALMATGALLGAVTMQTGWLLRPFVARPTAEVAFLRPIEADVFAGLIATTMSAVDVATPYEAPTWEIERGGFLSSEEGR